MTSPLPLQELATLRLAAASALVTLDERLYVLGDDELLLQRYSLTGGFIGQQSLLAGELPQEPAERKRLKPDFEMLCVLPDGRLLALGSGSTAQRCRAVLVDGEQHRMIDLSELYDALATQLPELNLEGAVVQGQQLLLAQRGNGRGGVNALISLDLSRVLSGLHQGVLSASALCTVQPVELGGWQGVPLSLTDLCLDGQGRLLFSAAAEDTTSSYHDGACAGSVIGCLDAGRVSRQWPLAGQAKIEGLVMLADGSLRLVNDPDDRQQRSRLFRLDLPQF